MARRCKVGKWRLLVLLGVLVGARPGVAQTAGAGGTSTAIRPGPGVPAAADLYANSYLNPYLNPYAAAPWADRNDVLLWFLATQQVRGRGEEARPRPEPAVWQAERPRSLMVPGGGAAGYFNRRPAAHPSGGPPTRRQDRYFGKNGR